MKSNLKAIIVDDEPLARKIIREYLQDFPMINIVAECKNGRQAIKIINEEKPDIIFLDINMPGKNGFEVLEQIEIMPQIIFTTAYSDYALKAFEVNAIDYLLKPYDKKRFANAVNKVISMNSKSESEIDSIIQLMQQTKEPSAQIDRIFIRTGRKIISILLADIIWIEADGDYTQLHTAKNTYISNLSMNNLEQKLDPNKFIRVHRSYIVSSDSIEHLVGDGEGGFIISLKDGNKVNVSRTYAPKFRTKIW